MSTSIGNLAVVVSAQTDPAEARIRDLRKTFGLLDRDAKTLGRGAGGTAAAVLAGDRGAAAKAQAQAAREQRQAQRVERQQAAQHAREKERAGRAEERRQRHREQASRESSASRAVVATAALGPEVAGLLGFAGPAGVAVAAIALVKDGFNATVPEALRLAGAAEQNAAAFEVMLGSADKARVVLAGLRKYAADSPFNSPQVMDAAKRLQAYGVAGDDLVDTLKALGNIAAGTGGDLNLMAVAYGQVRTNGRLMGQELLQFTNQGVPLIENVAAVMGKPQESIKKLIEDGEVGFDVVQKAINRMTTSGGKFAGMADRYGGTFKGLTDRVKDASDGLLRDFGTSLIEDLDLKEWMRGGLDAMKEIRPVLQDLRPVMRGLGDGGKAFLAVFAQGAKAVRPMSVAILGMVQGLQDAAYGMKPLLAVFGVMKEDGWIDWHQTTRVGLNAINGIARPALEFFDKLEEGAKGIGREIEKWGTALKLAFQNPGAVLGLAGIAAAGGNKELAQELTARAMRGEFDKQKEEAERPREENPLKPGEVPAAGAAVGGWKGMNQLEQNAWQQYQIDKDSDEYRKRFDWSRTSPNPWQNKRLKESRPIFIPADRPEEKQAFPDTLVGVWDRAMAGAMKAVDNDAERKAAEREAERLHRLRDNLTAAFGGPLDRLRDAVPAVDHFARRVEEATGPLRALAGIRVDERFPAKLQEEAMKLMAPDSPFADPSERFRKRMKDLETMYRGTLDADDLKELANPNISTFERAALESKRKIDARTRDLAVNEEVMRLGGRDLSERRPAPAIEQGTQEAVRLQQQATANAANGPADVVSLLQLATRLLDEQVKQGAEARRKYEAQKNPTPVVLSGGK